MNKSLQRLLKVVYKPKHETKWYMFWNAHSGIKGALLLTSVTFLPLSILGIMGIISYLCYLVLWSLVMSYLMWTEKYLRKLIQNNKGE